MPIRTLTASLLLASVATIPTTDQSSVSYNGTTWTFDRAMPVGFFVTGEPFVVSDEAFSITSVTPASTQISSEWANGLVIDPYLDDNNDQGFDEAIGNTSQSGRVPYDDSLNIDPGRTGSNVSVPLGAERSYVKAIRQGGGSGVGTGWQVVEAYNALTVLSSAPPVGCFRPNMTGTTKYKYTTSDIDLSVFRSITLPGSWTHTLTSVEANLADDPGIFGENGEGLRRLRLDGISNNYSAALAERYSAPLVTLHDDRYSDAEKQDLLYKIVTWAIQMEGCYDEGFRGAGAVTSGAGQIFCYIPHFVTGAFALQSATMLTKIGNMETPFDQCFWIGSDDWTVYPFGEDSGDVGSGFFEEHWGEPFLSASQDLGPQPNSRYGDEATRGNQIEAVAVFLLQNGPGGETGFSWRNNGAYGTSNDKSAIWGYMDKASTMEPWPNGTGTGISGAIWDVWTGPCRSLSLYTAWTGRPTQVWPGGDNGWNHFTAGTGSISFDFSGFDYSTQTKTGRKFLYSLDGTQYVEDTSVTDNDTVTGLLQGVTHYCDFQFQNASGYAAPTPNFDYSDIGSTPNTVTTGGSRDESTAPGFTTNPIIHAKRNPNWNDVRGNWKPVSGTLAKDDTELKVGRGYTNRAVDSWAYQWRRNGSAISGATNQTYTLTGADAGTDITCDVTPTNSAGAGSTYTTVAVTIPAVTSLPAGTLIDTDFKGGFTVDYASELASLAVINNSAAEHRPGAQPNINSPIDAGGIFMDKTGSFPSIRFDLSNAAQASTNYVIDAGFIVVWAKTSGDYRIQIKDGTDTTLVDLVMDGATELDADQMGYSPSGQQVNWGRKAFTDVAFTTGSNTSLRVEIIGSIGDGGQSGADMTLYDLHIREAA